MYRLVVFDLDGTLVDSLDDLAAAVDATLERHGMAPLGAENVVRFIGNGARRLVEGCVRERVPDPSEDRVSAALETFQETYRRGCLDRTRTYPGIDGCLRALRDAGRELAVLTNKPRSFTDEILSGLSLDGLFSAVLGGDDLPTRKPDPTGLLHIVEGVGCRREEAILVGDSTVDIETARRARIESCAVTWGLGTEAVLRASGPGALVADAGALRRHLLGPVSG